MPKLRAVTVLAASLSAVALTTAHAGATAGSVWLNVASDSAATLPSGMADATFAPGAIDYNPTDSFSVYTLGAFLNNPVFNNQSAAFVAAGGANASFSYGSGNTFIDITGTIGLLNGNNAFVVAHDDGVVLNITGFGNVVDAPGPTAEDLTPFNVDNTGPAGNFAFNLQYVECCGPPATLQFSINNVTVGVPEPSTWAIMLVGFGGLGAAMRARRKLAPAA